LTLPDRILAFLSENPSSTVRRVARALDESPPSVAAYLTRMFKSRTVIRSKKSPFAYSLPDPSAAEAFLNSAPVPLRKETKLADEQLVLVALAEGRASNREALLALLRWSPNRLMQTVDRLHSAGLLKTTHGSYMLIPRNP